MAYRENQKTLKELKGLMIPPLQCCQIEIRKNPESRPKKSQNAVVFLKKSRDFSEFHDDVISFLYYIERVIIVYG